jgi:glutamate dehydrogenase/leucine dehydrogenase
MFPNAGSNMPCTVQAVEILRKAKVTIAPAKATAAGGVMRHLNALASVDFPEAI